MTWGQSMLFQYFPNQESQGTGLGTKPIVNSLTPQSNHHPTNPTQPCQTLSDPATVFARETAAESHGAIAVIVNEAAPPVTGAIDRAAHDESAAVGATTDTARDHL